MSSTTNVQNLLVNVFRPSYQYRTLPTPNYYVQLELSNVETVYANVIDAQNLRVSDANSNVYVGREAGNAYTDLRDCFSNTTLGYGAGRAISNTDRGIYIGYNAGTNSSNASNVIAIGSNASGRGTSNICLGNSAGGVDGEANNVYIGNGVTTTGGTSNRLLIGSGADPSGAVISADFANRRVGIWTSNPTQYPVEIANYTFISNGLGINCDPRAHTLNVNGDCRMEDGFGLFTFDQDRDTSDSTFTFWSYTQGKAGMMQFGYDISTNPVFLAINKPPVSNAYNLDVSGTVRIDDLSGNLVTFQNKVVTSTNGYASIQGVTAGLAALGEEIIGTWKNGITKVVAHSPGGTSYHGGDWIFTPAGAAVPMLETSNVLLIVDTSGADIVIRNSTGTPGLTFRYNVTHFTTP